MDLDSDSDSSVDWSTPVAPAVNTAKHATLHNNKNDSKNNTINNSNNNSSNTMKGEAAMLAARRRAFQNQRKGVTQVTSSTSQTNTVGPTIKNDVVITQTTNPSTVKENSTSSLPSSRQLHEQEHERHQEQRSSTIPSVNTRHKVHRKSSSASTSHHDHSVSSVHVETNEESKVQINNKNDAIKNKMNEVSSVVSSPPAPAPAPAPAPVVASLNTNTIAQEMSEVEKLRLEIETKRKTLELLREEEKEQESKWRTTRASKQAELSALERRLYTLRNEIDEMKTSTERALQHEDDQRESEVHKNRSRLEASIKEEFEPQVQLAQDKLSHVQQSERELLTLLKRHENVNHGSSVNKSTTKKEEENDDDDLVMLAVANAAQAIMNKLENEFAVNDVADKMAWREELREQIAHEVHTSFTVGVESEWESEQKRQRQLIDELDSFVRDVASQQRSRFDALDDAFASEMQLLAEQSMRVLEEQSSKVINRFDQLREKWIAQQQTILTAQMKAHMARRESELNEQCRWRDELYKMQLNQCNDKHGQATCNNEELHTRTMDALHKYMSQQEKINKMREGAITQVCHAGSEFSHSVQSIQEQIELALRSLANYENGVDASCQTLNANHKSSLCTQREMLQTIQSFITVECDRTDSERRGVNELTNKLRIAEGTLQRCLDEEAINMHEFEARSKSTKEEWTRCYRQWMELVQRETHCTADEFDRLLRALRERSFAMKCDKQTMHEYIHELQQILQSFHDTIHDGVDVLHEQENEVTNKYHSLTEQITSVQKESTKIKEELQKMTNEKEQTNNKQREVDGLKAQLVAEVQSLETLRKELELTRRQHAKDLTFTQEFMTRVGASIQGRNKKTHEYEILRSKATRTQSRALADQRDNVNVNYNTRLPVKVLREMQDALARSVTHEEQSFHVNRFYSRRSDKENHLHHREHLIKKVKLNQQQKQEQKELKRVLLPPHSHVVKEGKDTPRWSSDEQEKKHTNSKYGDYNSSNYSNDSTNQMKTMHNNYVQNGKNVTSPPTCFQPTTSHSRSRSRQLRVCEESGTYDYMANTEKEHIRDNDHHHHQQLELESSQITNKTQQLTRGNSLHDGISKRELDKDDSNMNYEQSQEVDQSISINESLLPAGQQEKKCLNADETMSTTANTFTNLLALSDADTLLLTP